MNTTPITFEKKKLEYTLIGGSERSERPLEPKGFSVLLLNRGGKPFRKELLEELVRLNCLEIIWVEKGNKPDENETLSVPYHILRIKGDNSPGDIINVGIKEALGKYVLVLWSDMVLDSAPISSRVFEKIEERDFLCTVPILKEKDKILPSCSVPMVKGRRNLDVFYHDHMENRTPTLFPYDYCGIYSREKFLDLGGFDGTMSNPYWQLMDLGFRAALWGECIVFQDAIVLNYLDNGPVLDITADGDYGHFFMKTQAVVVNNGVGRLPGYRLLAMLIKTHGNGMEVFRDFQRIRAWVRQNRSRFVHDVASLLSQWKQL